MEKDKLEEIKYLLAIGAVSYDKAKELATPFIDSINKKIISISKEFNQKPKLISFSKIMR